jgi:hypothetical protein
MDDSKRREPPPKKQPAPAPAQEGSVKHVVRTGLPPGIEVDDFKDPGKNSPKGPADDRS